MESENPEKAERAESISEELRVRAQRSLLGPGPDWQFNAAPDTSVVEVRWSLMANSYRETGDILVEACRSQPDKRNTLINPLIFVYRHAIELKLKSLIKISSSQDKEGTADQITHDLIPLWRLVKRRSKAFFETNDQLTANDVQSIEKYINDFSELDRDGTQFRYPVDKVGNVRTHGTNYLNFVQIGTGAAVLFDVFDRIAYWYESNSD